MFRQLSRSGLRPGPLLALSVTWSLALVGSCATTAPAKPASAPCRPQCAETLSCGGLDARLVAARKPLLRCIGKSARVGHLSEAHRCYRALRLLESARWWLKTLLGRTEIDAVYQPSETVRREFLCRIEQLAEAEDPEVIEELYLEMIRSYP